MNKKSVIFEEKGEVLGMIVSYIASLVIAVLGIMVWFNVQDAAIVLLQRYNTNTYDQAMSNSVIIQAITVGAGIIWVIVFFILQHYFDKHIMEDKIKVVKCFCLTVAIEILCLVVLMLLRRVL